MLLERSSARAPGPPTKRHRAGARGRLAPLAAVARPRLRRAAPDLRRAFDLATAAVGVGPASRPGGVWLLAAAVGLALTAWILTPPEDPYAAALTS